MLDHRLLVVVGFMVLSGCEGSQSASYDMASSCVIIMDSYKDYNLSAARMRGLNEVCQGQKVFCAYVPKKGHEAELSDHMANEGNGSACNSNFPTIKACKMFRNPLSGEWKSSLSGTCNQRS